MPNIHAASSKSAAKRTFSFCTIAHVVATTVSRGVLLWIATCLVSMAALAQSTDPNSTFSDLDPAYDGGVAAPTDGSTGNVLQQTLLAAYFWSKAHGGARATVVVASDYPISGSRILVPGNVDLVCSSYSPHTYGGGCWMFQTDSGNNMASGGSPLLLADYRFGVLPDHKTICSTLDNPQQPGCTIINSSGASIRGFTLRGKVYTGGGADAGIRVFADSVDVEDTNEEFFGGPGIQVLGGINISIDWNFGTNLDMWWCANPSQLTMNIGGLDLGGMLDGEASHNQYSTGCSFVKGNTVSLEYPHLAAMYVGGGGNLIQSNLLQADEIALLATGQNHRVVDNRLEFQAREAIRNTSWYSVFANNRVTSPCLDPNLANLRPGSLDNGSPLYPGSPTFLSKGYIVMDPSGNIEQLNNAGTSGAVPPDWSVESGGTTLDGNYLTWTNIGPWKAGLTDNTDPGPMPALVSGLCYGVVDTGGGGNTWSGNQVTLEVGIGGVSYLRGDYMIATNVPASISANICERDLPDASGNGQCWWGGDLFDNGGPAYLAPNGRRVTASGGGTAWVGDYSVLVLDDNVPRHYNNLQGMAEGQTFSITSSKVANVIDPWGIDPTNWNLFGSGGLYGHPSLQTCTGQPLVIAPGSYYQFYYHLSSTDFTIRQINCAGDSTPGTDGNGISLSPSSLTFGTQNDGTISAVQTVTVNNSGSTAIPVSVAISDQFAQTNTCGGAIAAGTSCTVSVVFAPTALGAHIGALTITDNGSGSVQAVSLAGVGAEVSSSPQPGSIASISLASSAATLNVPSGLAGKAKLTVTPEGDFTGIVSLKCEVTPLNQTSRKAAPTCSLSPAQMSIKDNVAGISTLVISTQPSSAAVSLRPLVSMSLAGLAFVGLFPLARVRKLAFVLSIGLVLIMGAVGCGYVPNTNSGSANNAGAGSVGSREYKVSITATSTTGAISTISIPVTVQLGN